MVETVWRGVIWMVRMYLEVDRLNLCVFLTFLNAYIRYGIPIFLKINCCIPL